SGQRLASGFTIPGGPSAKRPTLEEISAIGHHQGTGMENQPPSSSATITPSSSALQNRLAAGPFEAAQSVEPTVVMSPSDEQPPDVESLTSRLSLPEIHFDLTKGFPRVLHKLSLKEKAVKIVGALMTTPPVHLSLLLGQMLACLLSAVYAVSQLTVVGSPSVPSYFQLSREALAETLEGYFRPTWSGVLLLGITNAASTLQPSSINYCSSFLLTTGLSSIAVASSSSNLQDIPGLSYLMVLEESSTNFQHSYTSRSTL
ncbi:Spindle assembly abnormal protein 6, partial [Perkinsus olseni]